MEGACSTIPTGPATSRTVTDWCSRLNSHRSRWARTLSAEGKADSGSTGLPDSRQGLASRAHASPTTNTVHHFSMIRGWLDDCRRSHQHCREPKRPERLPTRLLHVEGDQNTVVVKLWIVDQTEVDLEYLTLSHCWGRTETMTLNKDTLDPFQHTVPWDEIPKTFKDAFIITNELGFSYIWIDSLCIRQDSPADWARESALMGDVYAGAVLNIAASAATNSGEGCFEERDIRGMVDCRFGSQGQDANSLRLCMCDMLQTRFESQVDASPLNARAWVFQERLLSNRIVHYTSRSVFWECQTCTMSEQHPSTPKKRSISNQLPLMPTARHYDKNGQSPGRTSAFDFRIAFDKLKLKLNQVPRSHLKAHESTRRWYELVSKYTLGALTRSSDKLVAIDGIATQIALSSGLNYTFGLWKEFLVYNLLWSVEIPSRPDSRILGNGSPSWSWASLNGVVRYQHEAELADLECVASAHVVATETEDESESSRPRSQRLVLSGVLREIGVINAVENDVRAGMTYPLRDHVGNRVGKCIPDRLGMEGVGTVFVLELLNLVKGTGHNASRLMLGLVLRRCSDASEPAFQRIGYFSSGLIQDTRRHTQGLLPPRSRVVVF